MIGKEAPFAHLRPTTTPEMLDRAYVISVRFAPLLFGASFIFAAEHLLTMFLDTGAAGEDPISYTVAALLGLVLLGEYTAAIALLALFQGLIFPLRPLSGKALVRTAFRKLPGYLLTHLLYVFSVTLAAVISWGFFTSQQQFGGAYSSAAAGITTGAAGLYVAIRLSLSPIASLIEDTNPLRAFGRSWHLTSTRPGSTSYSADRPPLRWFAIAALPTLVMAVIFAGFAAYSKYELDTFILASTDETAPLKDMLWFSVTWTATPFYWAGLMALYVEYRMRHEGLDFYLRIRELRRQNGETDAVH